jgi:glycosyltransferase involved in cell wall biosynthesis
MHYLGNDVQGYKKSVEKYKWSNMPGFIGNNDPSQYDMNILKRLAYETRYVDLQIVGGPYLSEFVKNSLVLPIAIDIDNYTYAEHPQNDTLIILHAPTHRGFKGTEYIIAAIQKLISEGYSLKLNLVENAPHSKMKEEHIKADFFIDQIMAGWYGTASIEAMALGRPVICSIRQSYFDFIDYGHKIPIIHADPDCIYDSIKFMIVNKEKLPEIGRACRKFVEEVHDIRKLTGVLIEHYQKIWS